MYDLSQHFTSQDHLKWSFIIIATKQKLKDNFCNTSIVLLHIQQLWYTFQGLF